MSAASLGRTEIEIDGEGPPVVFLHGLGATSSCFQPLLSSLRGFRCIRPDFPGAGRSPRPYVPVTIEFSGRNRARRPKVRRRRRPRISWPNRWGPSLRSILPRPRPNGSRA